METIKQGKLFFSSVCSVSFYVLGVRFKVICGSTGQVNKTGLINICSLYELLVDANVNTFFSATLNFLSKLIVSAEQFYQIFQVIVYLLVLVVVLVLEITCSSIL